MNVKQNSLALSVPYGQLNLTSNRDIGLVALAAATYFITNEATQNRQIAIAAGLVLFGGCMLALK